MTTKVELPVEVQNTLDWLQDAGFTAAVVGGYCRALKYNKVTNDIDIAVLVETLGEIEVLQNEFGAPVHKRSVLEKAEKSLYAGHTGFVADWREGNINIIAYDKYSYKDIPTLVQSFDFNFNMWYVDEDGTLKNHDPFVGVHKVRLGSSLGSRPSVARLARFYNEFSAWDWKLVDEQLQSENEIFGIY
ncbi:nucleotidyltransferase [Acinetobacter phage Fri1]|uniref:Putative tRNA nucleotidyltransferase n=1 Tax=Acinetobacter phage Fri1 TaxID=1647373 RepID=A0A0H4THZ4_9CAUD|nr:nucleotidyltransferase [Acinetobacter phage Fri1]AKQ06837.1 putative tRNA nucleotidyltransferase [Acinetobacter phage Fri1]